ncbi:hypothetical protein FSP39_007625 [Pinctada imbricata]|uniref:ZAD domain-containing protein n=1 Tax=Pinctada imbricata TaxID=66713 RepID=A0AA89BK66_PINIB|nr:hypothetical protein FSP39_007625 [Pinctada imbricata]
MAASSDGGNTCRICHENLPKKYRRSIFSESFGVFSQLTQVLDIKPHSNDGLSSYVCGFCFSKLNKLSKINYDLVNKMGMLQKEKQDLVLLLRTKYVTSIPATEDQKPRSCGGITPRKKFDSNKRMLKHSPTPRKLKIRPNVGIRTPTPKKAGDSCTAKPSVSFRPIAPKPVASGNEDTLKALSHEGEVKSQKHIDSGKQFIQCSPQRIHIRTLTTHQTDSSTPPIAKSNNYRPIAPRPGGGDVIKTFSHEEFVKPKRRINVNLLSPSKLKLRKKENLREKENKRKNVFVGCKHIQVLYQTKGKTNSRIVKDADTVKLVKALSKGMSKQNIAKMVINSKLKDEISKCVFKEINKELETLISPKSICVLRGVSSDKIAVFRFKTLLFEVQLHAPILYKCLSMTLKDSPVGMAMTAAIILKKRNMHMSSFHHIVSQILDHGGTSDETISILHKLGLCASSQSTSKKRSELVERQNFHVKSLILDEKESIEKSQSDQGILAIDLKSADILVYQKFYKEQSAGDVGTLSQLRNVTRRIDVHGSDDVIKSYRSHFAFIEDYLDAMVTGACLHLLGLESLDSQPTSRQELFEAIPDSDKLKYIKDIARDILDKYINISQDLQDIEQQVQELDLETLHLKNMFDPSTGIYTCSACTKQYKTEGFLKRHLVQKHGWQGVTNLQRSEQTDRVAIYHSSLMKCVLLLRDTNDAYKMGDGDRIMMNAKFQMLLSGVGHHGDCHWNCCRNHRYSFNSIERILLIWMCKRNKNPFANAKYKLVPPRSLKPHTGNTEPLLNRQGSYVNSGDKPSSKRKRSSKKRKDNGEGGDKEPYEIVENRKNIGASLRPYSDTSFDKLRRHNSVNRTQDDLNDYGTVRPMVESAQYDTTFSLKQGLNNPDEPYDSMISGKIVIAVNEYETTFGLHEKSSTIQNSPQAKPLHDTGAIPSVSDCKENIQEHDVEMKKSSNDGRAEAEEERNAVPLDTKKNVNYANVSSENPDNFQTKISEDYADQQCRVTSSNESSLAQEELDIPIENETFSEIESESSKSQEGNLDNEVFIENTNEDHEMKVNLENYKDTKEIQTEDSYLLMKIKEKERRERQSACTQVDDIDFEED